MFSCEVIQTHRRHLKSFYLVLVLFHVEEHFTVFSRKFQSVVLCEICQLQLGWWVEPAAVIGQQGHGVLASCSTVSPLLRRNASCLGSRPRNFFNISDASSEPPGRRM